MRESVFNGEGNVGVYQLSQNGQDFNLSDAGITKVEVIAGGKCISSETDDVEINGNEISWRLSALNLSDDFYPDAAVRVFFANAEIGRIIIGPGLDEELILDVRTLVKA